MAAESGTAAPGEGDDAPTVEEVDDDVTPIDLGTTGDFEVVLDSDSSLSDWLTGNIPKK